MLYIYVLGYNLCRKNARFYLMWNIVCSDLFLRNSYFCRKLNGRLCGAVAHMFYLYTRERLNPGGFISISGARVLQCL